MSIGTFLTHDSAKLHVSGQARYIDDIPCPRIHFTLPLVFQQSQRVRLTGWTSVAFYLPRVL